MLSMPSVLMVTGTSPSPSAGVPSSSSPAAEGQQQQQPPQQNQQQQQSSSSSSSPQPKQSQPNQQTEQQSGAGAAGAAAASASASAEESCSSSSNKNKAEPKIIVSANCSSSSQQQQQQGGASASPTASPGTSTGKATTKFSETEVANRQQTPHYLVYKRMEKIIEKMQEETTGVPVRTVKSFMSKIPSVFTGTDLVSWILRHTDVEDQNEALHVAHLLAAHGYIFPIEDHILTVKNDSTFYRFQTPYFWPSNSWDPENSDYAVYLCKRTMQNKTRLELVDYEAENLARLQKMFSRKWEFIFMQAEAQSKVDKKRDKLERKVLDSQERAFWDVHRPSPGCVNTTEMDIKKVCRMNRPRHGGLEVGGKDGQALKVPTAAELQLQIKSLKYKLDRHSIKISKVAELHMGYYDMYSEYDPFIAAPEPSNPWLSDSTDFWDMEKTARTMQNKTRLELVDYEAENLARLQKMFSRKWEFIFMQAEAQSKVDKKRDKLERKVLDSQERAFWDVHRPSPGCVNTTEMDIKKVCRMNRPRHGGLEVGGKDGQALKVPTAAELQLQIKSLKYKLDRHSIKISKVAELHMGYYDMYSEYDPFIAAPEPSNPWLSDSTDFWDMEKTAKDIPARRVRRWGFSVEELLKDPVGREHFVKFLEKEFSAENLKFWEAVQELKRLPMSEVPKRAEEIWQEFLAPDATCLVNVDSHSYEQTRKNIQDGNPDRWSFDTALAHVYHLMKSDSYSRYIRSEMYKDFLNGAKKKVNFLSLPTKFRGR